MALDTNLIAYWKLDESSGNASDATGNGFTASNSNSVGFSTGKINNGAVFNGVNQIFTYGNIGITGSHAFTISAWIKTTQTSNNRGIVNIGTNSSTNKSFSMTQYDNGSDHFLKANFWGGGTIAIGETNINTGNWVFCTVTYDGTYIKLYVNGSLEDTSGSVIGNITGSTNNYIGLEDSSGSNGLYFNGMIDEVGIWNRVLTADEVTQLYNGGAGLSYPFSSPVNDKMMSFFLQD